MLEHRSVLHARPLMATDPDAPIRLTHVHPVQCLQWMQWPGADDFALVELARAVGLTLPADGRQAAVNEGYRLLRVGPDRALFLSIDGRFDPAAFAPPAQWVDVSHSRSLFRLTGPGARDVLTHGVPIELREDRFPPRSFARTRLGHLDVLVLNVEKQPVDCFEVLVHRSHAVDLLDWLQRVMAEAASGK